MIRPIAFLFTLALVSACSDTAPPAPDVDFAANAERWVDDEFQPSTLSRDAQVAELAWFTDAAEPFRE